jgi:hypothetical protein
MKYIPYFRSVTAIDFFDTGSSSEKTTAQDMLLKPDLCSLSSPLYLPIYL